MQVKSATYSLCYTAMMHSVLPGVCFVALLFSRFIFFSPSSSSSSLCVWCVVALGAISTIRLDRPENDISAITLMVAAQY